MGDRMSLVDTEVASPTSVTPSIVVQWAQWENKFDPSSMAVPWPVKAIKVILPPFATLIHLKVSWTEDHCVRGRLSRKTAGALSGGSQEKGYTNPSILTPGMGDFWGMCSAPFLRP